MDLRFHSVTENLRLCNSGRGLSLCKIQARASRILARSNRYLARSSSDLTFHLMALADIPRRLLRASR
jgi:hypothetical protein